MDEGGTEAGTESQRRSTQGRQVRRSGPHGSESGAYVHVLLFPVPEIEEFLVRDPESFDIPALDVPVCAEEGLRFATSVDERASETARPDKKKNRLIPRATEAETKSRVEMRLTSAKP